MRDSYTLEFPVSAITSTETITSPEVILSCSVIYALAVSMAKLPAALMLSSILPVICLTRCRDMKSLAKLNIINIIMIITLGLTWPVFSDGIMAGVIIALRVNMIYIVLSSLVFPMGMAKIYSALCSLGLPEKLRVLLLLTFRGIYILHDRLNAAITAVKLRAPVLKGVMKLKVIAYVFASVLLQSSDRAERMMTAIECRGGFGGFMQMERQGLTRKDIAVLAMTTAYALAIMIVNYA